MSNKPSFWLIQIAGLSLLYLAAVALAVSGESAHWVVKLCLLLLAIHVLELPLAMRALKGKPVAPARLLLLTVLYGLLWWVPASRGVFQGR